MAPAAVRHLQLLLTELPPEALAFQPLGLPHDRTHSIRYSRRPQIPYPGVSFRVAASRHILLSWTPLAFWKLLADVSVIWGLPIPIARCEWHSSF